MSALRLSCTPAGLLSAENIDVERLSTVLWYPAGGYACYFVEVGTQFVDVPAQYEKVVRAGTPRHRSDPLRLRWVPIDNIRSFIRFAAAHTATFSLIILLLVVFLSF